MTSTTIWGRAALGVLVALGAASVWAQTDAAAPSSPMPISAIRTNPVVLYAEPDLSAAQKKIPVPNPIGSDWQVLGTHLQFYDVQAGSERGWIRRAQVTVNRTQGLPTVLCSATTSTTPAPTGTAPGIGAGC